MMPTFVQMIIQYAEGSNNCKLIIIQCSPVKVNQCFGGTYRLHFQGRTVSQVRNQQEAGNKQ
jgi:hypothetical protein